MYSGNDLIITDYQSGKDSIQLGSGITFSSASVDTVSKSVVVTTNEGDITLQKAAKVSSKGVITGNKVKIVDADGNTSSRVFGLNSITMSNTDGDTVNLKSNILSDITAVNASSRKATAPIYMIGNSLGNTLKGGKGADTIVAGSGNDYLTGSSGADLFIYSGGNDTVSDYTATKKNTAGDRIQIGTGLSTVTALSSYQIIGNDVIIPFGTGDSLTIVKGKDKEIIFTDSSDVSISAMSFTYNDPSIKYLDASTSAVYNFIDSDVSTERIMTVDATKRSKSISVTASTTDTTKTLTLKGTKAADTLDGGIYDNVLTGGKGKDIFIFSGGHDTITDYTAGQDTISIVDSDLVITSATVAANGTDVIFNLSTNNSITVQNAIKKGNTAQKLTINDHGNVTAQTYGQARFAVTNSDGAANATINAGTPANEGVVKSVIASSRGKKFPIYLVGNNLNNSLVGGAGDDTLNGYSATSSGKNTLTGGKGSDLFIYSGGYDIITDYTNSSGNSDSIQIATSLVSDYYLDGDDVILQDKSDNDLIKIINGKDKYINIIDASGADTSLSKVYSNPHEKIFMNADYDNSITSYTAASGIYTITASNRKTAIEINGSSETKKITGGTGADKITANSNSSKITLTGGKGNDTFNYNGGTVIISDYTAGQDAIAVHRNDCLDYHVWNNDVYFSFGTSASSVSNVNKLFIVGGANKKISTTINGSASVGTYKDYESTILSGSSALTVNANSGSDLTKIVTFDGSKLKSTAPLNIIGNKSFGNVLKGGAGADTLDGGDTGTKKYDDLLIGNKGNDTFVYRGGNDVISDYTANQDVISVVGGLTYVDYEVSGKDIVMDFDDYSLTITNGLDKTITFIGESATALMKTYNDYTQKVFAKNDSATSFDGTLSTNASVTLIDASKKASAMTLTANNNDSTIKGGSKNDSIIGGSGDDYIIGNAGNDTISAGFGTNTLTGGKGYDTFIIGTGSGRDIITDYVAGQDIIHLESGVSISSVSYADSGDSETDLQFNFSGSNKTLVVQNAIKITSNTKITPQKITFEDYNGNQIRQTFMQSSLSIANADGDTIDLRTNYNHRF